MNLPKVVGVLSDSTKLEWDDLDQTVAKLKYLDITPSGVYDFTGGWTEVDSGTNVNISGGEVTMNGSNTAQQNGLYHTNGISLAEGYFEFDTKVAGSVAIGCIALVNTSAGLPLTRGTGTIGLEVRTTNFQPTHAANVTAIYAMSYNTYYTIRLYVKKSINGTTWGRMKITVQGGTDFPSETVLTELDLMLSSVVWPATMYLTLQRVTTDSDLTYFRKVKMYFGLATDGPYTTYTHDAGSGKTFDNFDMTSLAMPGSIASANLKFDYYFGDDAGGALSGTWRTLAQLNALGKVSERHRYIKIAVQNNSDGATQAYGAKPNADTATDGCGDFPAVANLRDNDTVQGTTGTLSSDKILKSNPTPGNWNDDNITSQTDATNNFKDTLAVGLGWTGGLQSGETNADNILQIAGGTSANMTVADTKFLSLEAGRNKFQTGSSASDILSGKGVVFAGVDVDGTSDKIYSAADEEARNEIPDLSKVPTPASGGPASWLARNVSRVGTWNLTTWEAARNTALKAFYKLGEVFKLLGADTTGEYTGGGAFPDPTAPVCAAVALSDTSVLVTGKGGLYAESFLVERKTGSGSYSTVKSGFTGSWTDTTVSADTIYYYRIKATNTTSSVYSNAVEVLTKQTSGYDKLTRIEAAMAALIENMAVVDGYYYDWGVSNRSDKAQKDGTVNAEIFILQEENLDNVNGGGSTYYTNQTDYEIHVDASNVTVADAPEYTINKVMNEALNDLKKLFNANQSLSNNCNIAEYRGFKREPYKNGDILNAAKMVVTYRIHYTQDRSNPENN